MRHLFTCIERREGLVAFQRILVPLDGSPLAEQAIPYARAVAHEDGVLFYAQVVPKSEAIHGLTGGTVATAGEVGTLYDETATVELKQIADRWISIAPRYELRIGAGDPAEQILALADANECDLIVIASHGRGALGRWTFGSVADNLSRKSDVPVMIIRPHKAQVEVGTIPEFNRVIAPTDGSNIAAEALDEAALLGKHLKRPVVLMRAIFPEAELAPTTGFEAVYAPDVYDSITQNIEDDAQKSLDAIAQNLRDDGVEVEIALLHGPAAQTIEEEAKPDDIIVMASHGRSGFKRWLIGSVAEKLVRTAPCPVVLVRAPDADAKPAKS